MRNGRLWRWAVLLILSVPILSACGGATPPPTAAPTATTARPSTVASVPPTPSAAPAATARASASSAAASGGATPPGTPPRTAGASPTAGGRNPQGCVDRYDPNADYFPDKVELKYIQGATIRYAKSYKVLTVAFDRFTAGLKPETVVMVQCGTPAPPLTGDLAGARIVTVPAKTMTLTRNEDLGIVASLGLADGLKSHAFSPVYPNDINARIQSGAIKNTGGGLDPSTMNFEVVADLKPDVVVFGLQSLPAGVAAMDRLNGLGLQVMPSLTTIETTPLGRAEWAKIVAMPFNKEAEANTLVGDIFTRYQELSAKAKAKAIKPTVVFAQCGTNGQCTVARNSWQAKILEDAGGRNLLADNGPQSLQPLGIEALFEQGADADFMVWFSSPGEKYNGPLLPRFQSYQRDQIFGNDTPAIPSQNGQREFFYLAALRPDLLLSDMVVAFYPDLLPGYTPRFIGQSPYR